MGLGDRELRSFLVRGTKVREWYFNNVPIGATQKIGGYFHFTTKDRKRRDRRPSRHEAVEVLVEYHKLTPTERRQALKETTPPRKRK
jgi:hypothetical protein